MSLLPSTYVADIADAVGETVRLAGWVYNKTEKGRLVFIQLRDGTGVIQCVVFKKNVAEAVFQLAKALTQESSCYITGTVREDERSPIGVELDVTDIECVSLAEDYPITPKEHGTQFLMEHRHLWVRSAKQHALLRIRAEVIAAAQQYLNGEHFVRFDSPVLTATAAEGTSNLFATDYFDLGKAYLAQTGQLYVESGMMTFGRVYCFGPTFRAEKSKTRRHLTEFWMIEPELAFADQDDNMELQENFVSYIVQRVLDQCADDLHVLERDTSALEQVVPPFPRMSYDEAVERIQRAVQEGATVPPDDQPLPSIEWGEDFGAPHETFLASLNQKPVFIYNYPTQVKAFYMQPADGRPEVVRCADLLAPEGYGEIIGGSQRIHDPQSCWNNVFATTA